MPNGKNQPWENDPIVNNKSQPWENDPIVQGKSTLSKVGDFLTKPLLESGGIFGEGLSQLGKAFTGHNVSQGVSDYLGGLTKLVSAPLNVPLGYISEITKPIAEKISGTNIGREINKSPIAQSINALINQPATTTMYNINRAAGLPMPSQGALEAGNLAGQLLGFRGLENITPEALKAPEQFKPLTELSKERLRQLINENKNKETGQVPTVEGKPTIGEAERQAQIGTAQRSGEGIQQEKIAQPDKGLEGRFKPNLEKSGVDADFKGFNKKGGKITGVVIDANVDPENPNPALRRSSITLKPEDFTPDKIKQAVENSKKAFQTSLEKQGGANREQAIQRLEPFRKPLEKQFGRLEDLSDTELNNLQKQYGGFEEVKPKLQPTEKIVSTAVNDNGNILTGENKFDSHNNIGEQKGIGKPEENTRGFIAEDEKGNQRFVGREEGAKIASESGQVEKPVDKLHSEDLQKAEKKTLPTALETESGYNEGTTKTPNIAGISQRVREARSDLTKVPPTQSGIGWNAQEALNRGDYLRKQGVSADEVINKFNQTRSLSDDDIAVVRSQIHDLQKSVNRAGDDYGVGSPEYKEALQKANDLENKAKPMQTQSSRIFSAQQGYEELDGNSKTGIIRYFETANKKTPTTEQIGKITELSNQNKILNDKINELESKTQELLRDHLEQSKEIREKTAKGSIKLSSKELADKIRRNAKIHKPGAFYSATPASLAWDAGVEVVAQTIEQGGKLVDAIQKGIEKLKETDWYKGLDQDKQKEAEKDFKQWHNNQSNIKVDLNTLRSNFTDKKDNKFTTAETNAIWQYAKDNYIDQGKGTYQDMIQNISQDLGLRPDQVRDAISQPKQIRDITDGIYRVQNRRRLALQQTKLWVESANKPGWQKFIGSLPSRFFGWYVFGHGTVFGVTHAGMELFRPTAWKNYFPALIRQFKYAYGDPALYEQAMTDLQNRPNYILAKRAGLANDPVRLYDDYMLTDKYFGKLGLTGERGFNSWKIYRQDMFDNVWDHLSDALKSDPNTAKELAKIINHSTGTADVRLPGTFNTAFFAPRLEASRWIRLFAEPAKALKTFTSWDKASLADKFAAKLIGKRAAEMIGTYTMLLAANEGINQVTGSRQHVNFSDPTKSDWMRFKAFGKVIDVSGGMASLTTLVARLLEAAITPQKEANRLSRGKGREGIIYSDIGKYARGKLSPFVGTGFSFFTHHDFSGNTLPPFTDKPLYKSAKHLSWQEYLLTQQMPIPISEGIKDVYDTMKSKGMSEPQIETILNGIFISAVAGGTGARVREEYKKEYKK